MTLWRDISRGDGPVFGALALTALASQMSVAISQILLGLALLNALVRIALRRDRPGATGVELPGLLFIGWALLMIPFSTDPGGSLILAKRFYLFSALWLCAWYVRGEGRRAVLLAALLVGAVFNCVYTIVTQSWLRDDFAHRISMMQHSIITGSWLVMSAALIALALVLHGRGRWPRGLAAGALLPMLAALVLTQSRSAWLGFAAGAVVVLALRRKRLVLILAAAGVLFFTLGPEVFRERLKTIVDPKFRTNVQRFQMWDAGVDLIKANPVTGVGDCSLKEFCPELYYPGNKGRAIRLSHFHSNTIMMAVIWGIPGLVLGLWFLIALVFRLWRRFRLFGGVIGRGPPWRRVWLVAALGVWTAVNVTGVFDWSFGDPELSLVFFMTFGAALSLD